MLIRGCKGKLPNAKNPQVEQTRDALKGRWQKKTVTDARRKTGRVSAARMVLVGNCGDR